MRTAEGLGVQRLVFSGYTPRYNDAKLLPHLREKLNRQIAKAALGAEAMVPQLAVDDLPCWLESQRKAGWRIIGLENNLSPEESPRRIILGTHLTDEKVVLILGEEVHGIPEEVRPLCEYFLEIPMVGRKESFNVSVATSIALWGLLHS